MKKSCDVLIVGAGIIGLAIARELFKRGIKRVALLEKESHLGAHASGRNSGVLHAGLYYANDSLKARFCSRGARLLKDYVQSQGMQVFQAGKVLLASEESDLAALDRLFENAQRNGVRVEKISEAELHRIEPAARTVSWALYSPDTAVIDPNAVLGVLKNDLTAQGVEIAMDEPALEIRSQDKTLVTRHGIWSYGHLVNAAGLHADRWAHAMGVGLHYAILPFRGRYRKLLGVAAGRVRGLIYPVPDARMPFLGVHFTKSTSGDVWIGPTAEPAFGRENYTGLEGIAWGELPRLLGHLIQMTLHNTDGLASHLREEILKRLPGGLLSRARRLVPGLSPQDLGTETKCGIRAQLVDQRDGRLVMDFVVEKGPNSTHILNTVSPGFTASFAFAEYIADLLPGVL